MAKFLRKGSLKLKCKECHNQHSFEGRDMIFDKLGKTHICSKDFYCGCDTKLKYEIEVAETPEGKLGEVKFSSVNCEIVQKIQIMESPF